MTGTPVQAPTVSVAVLNHRRPALLKRVLTAVAQLDYPTFEIVVVGDQPGIDSHALPEWLSQQVRYVHFAEPNICQARNHAIRAAGGEIIAFIDDDAVPEPNWLKRLVEPFQDPEVSTVGGVVRASDGVTIEWQGGLFDTSGQERPLLLDRDITTRTADEQNRTGDYLSLRGVNSAFRREALVQAGGFDEAIRYYLDETDMALRLAQAGWSAAIASQAEVHHLLVPNASRGVLRMPGDQHEIGAGKAVFCAKHAGNDTTKALDRFRQQRLAMLDPQMRLGLVRMSDRNRVGAQLEAGIRDGLSRGSSHPLTHTDTPPDFRPFEPKSAGSILSIAIDTGWARSMNQALLAFAPKLVAAGHRVSVFSFRSGPASLSVSYRDGIWLHRGGTWTWPGKDGGKSAIGRAARARSERARIAKLRGFDAVLGGTASGTMPHIELPGCSQKICMLAGHPPDADPEAILGLLQSVAEADETARIPNGRSIDEATKSSFLTSASAT